MVLPLEAWLLIIFSIIMLLFLKILLKWRTHYPVYIVFLLIIGLSATWVSHILVLGRYLEFPWRPFKGFTLNNVVYDLYLFPGFLLLVIDLGLKTKKIWLSAILFTFFTTIQDYLIKSYTTLLSYNKWTLYHTVSSSCIAFIICTLFFLWIEKHFSLNRR